MSTPAPLSGSERLVFLDVLRGFALLGILVVNMAAFKAPVLASLPGQSWLDGLASGLIAFAFQTKFYVLFSFLFGYGLSVQLIRSGEAAVPRFRRRLLALFVLGLAHALLLYVGDILVTYALLGAALLLLRHAPDRVLLRLAAALVGGTALVLAVLGIVVASLPGVPATFGADGAATTAWAVEAYRGLPAQVIAARALEYPATLAFALLGQGPTVLAMFLLGLVAGRHRLFTRVDEFMPLLRRVLGVGLLVGVPGGVVWAAVSAGNWTPGSAFLLGSAVNFATAPFLSAVYAVALLRLFQTARGRQVLAPLALLGRLALSNYLLQSLVGALLFTGYGLGWYGQVGAAVGLALSLVIFTVQLPLSAGWSRRFAQGPAEWVLRSVTYGHLQPWRRVPDSTQTTERGRTPGPS